jgi:hypothetical protein
MLGHEDLQDGDEVENEDRMKPLTLEFKSEALEASFRLYYGNRLAPRVVSALFEFAVVFGTCYVSLCAALEGLAAPSDYASSVSPSVLTHSLSLSLSLFSLMYHHRCVDSD